MSKPTTEIPIGRTTAALTVAALFLVAVLNHVDRQILTILLQSIKRDLHLSDTQLGLLTGPAFALCFAIAGLPLAALAERRSRKLVILLSLGVWSACTVAIGAVQTFAQLLAARMLVAVGEAGSYPASQSMVGDLYSRGRQAVPMALLSAGLSVGVLVGMVAGGLLDHAMGWRNAFVVVGLPGLGLAMFLFAFLKEPSSEKPEATARRFAPLAGIRQLWSIRPYRGIVIGATLHLLSVTAQNQWMAAYLMRAFSLPAHQVGVPLGLLVGCVGGATTVVGGILADRLSRTHPQWLTWLPAILMVAGMPMALAALFAPTFENAMWFLVVSVAASTAYSSPLLVAVQMLAPAGLRTTAPALMLLVSGIFGQACGPLITGFLSDSLLPSAPAASLRWALTCVIPVSWVAALVLWRTGASMHATGAAR